MKESNATENLINLLEQVKAAITEEDLQQARLSLLDYLGVTLGGEGKMAVFLGDNGDNNELLSIAEKAFKNGFYGHYLELDDGHRQGMCHPGVPIFSALLPMAAAGDISGERLLQAAILGYEATLRLACSVQPSHKKKGFHTSATCGTVGVAVAVSYLRNYSREQLQRAITAAVTYTGGTLLLQNDQSEMKPVNLGRAAACGIMAADAGKLPLIFPHDAIGGSRGFLELYTDTPKEECFFQKPGEKPMIHGIYRKIHGACRHAHPPIDCVLKIKKTRDIKPEEIRKIQVATHQLAIAGHDHQVCENGSVAKLSIPYGVACAIVFSHVSESAFEKATLENPVITNLAKKVFVTEYEEMTKALPKERGALVVITLEDGTKEKAQVTIPRGEPETPFTIEELLGKAMRLLRNAGIEEKTCKRICQGCLDFGRQELGEDRGYAISLYETIAQAKKEIKRG